YPFNSLNLANDLKRIYEAEYFERNTILRGKEVTQNQFSLWEKWNFFRGIHSFDALGFFSGTRFIDQNKTYIIGTVYPNPILVIGFYLTTLILCLLLLNDPKLNGSENLEVIIPIGIVCVILLLGLLYFRRRIGKSVEHELKIKKTHHNN